MSVSCELPASWENLPISYVILKIDFSLQAAYPHLEIWWNKISLFIFIFFFLFHCVLFEAFIISIDIRRSPALLKSPLYFLLFFSISPSPFTCSLFALTSLSFSPFFDLSSLPPPSSPSFLYLSSPALFPSPTPSYLSFTTLFLFLPPPCSDSSFSFFPCFTSFFSSILLFSIRFSSPYYYSTPSAFAYPLIFLLYSLPIWVKNFCVLLFSKFKVNTKRLR